MEAASYLQAYHLFQEQALNSRFVKHETVATLLRKLPTAFEQKVLGTSYEGRNLTLVKWGKGPVRVFMWSQMHGDEPTGTLALFDLFNFLQHPLFQATAKALAENCTLYMLPMVNPDGAERFWRRNAQQIDINRDFNQTATSEALLLKEARMSIAPHFGFNLHDQSNLWSVKKTRMPAVLSFLAPAYNEELHINEVRRNAMLVIADIYQNLKPLLPQQIGLFDDVYEQRAFGDNFQAEGTSTILIEAGGSFQDEEILEIRKYFFLSLLSGLVSIMDKKYLLQNLENYGAIPENSKEIFHILIKNLNYCNAKISLGINYEEEPLTDGMATQKCYSVKDIGDLNHLGAYHIFEELYLEIEGEITMDKPANFTLKQDKRIILNFKNGFLQSKL